MKIVFKLYISGVSAVSISALGNLRRALNKEKRNYTLEVIDVIEHPEELEKNNIISTPVLEKVEPEPTKRIIGDLIYDEKILSKFDLDTTGLEIQR